MEICKILTLSTAHITEETGQAIDKRYDPDIWGCNSWQDSFMIYPKEEFGWWVDLSYLTTEEELSSCPEDFAACCRLAIQNGCDWLCLDYDGPVEECLPTYEWE